MFSNISFIDLLFQSIFVGFGIFVLTTTFIRKKEDNASADSLIDSATLVIRAATITFLLMWLINIIEGIQDDAWRESVVNRMTGPYWVAFWMFPLCIGLLPQLLWIKRIRRSKAARIVILLPLLLTFYMERIVIWITSFHRDYIPAHWRQAPDQWDFFSGIIYWFVAIFIFSLLVGIIHLLRRKLSTGKP